MVSTVMRLQPPPTTRSRRGDGVHIGMNGLPTGEVGMARGGRLPEQLAARVKRTETRDWMSEEEAELALHNQPRSLTLAEKVEKELEMEMERAERAAERARKMRAAQAGRSQGRQGMFKRADSKKNVREFDHQLKSSGMSSTPGGAGLGSTPGGFGMSSHRKAEGKSAMSSNRDGKSGGFSFRQDNLRDGSIAISEIASEEAGGNSWISRASVKAKKDEPVQGRVWSCAWGEVALAGDAGGALTDTPEEAPQEKVKAAVWGQAWEGRGPDAKNAVWQKRNLRLVGAEILLQEKWELKPEVHSEGGGGDALPPPLTILLKISREVEVRAVDVMQANDKYPHAIKLTIRPGKGGGFTEVGMEALFLATASAVDTLKWLQCIQKVVESDQRDWRSKAQQMLAASEIKRLRERAEMEAKRAEEGLRPREYVEARSKQHTPDSSSSDESAPPSKGGDILQFSPKFERSQFVPASQFPSGEGTGLLRSPLARSPAKVLNVGWDDGKE